MLSPLLHRDRLFGDTYQFSENAICCDILPCCTDSFICGQLYGTGDNQARLVLDDTESEVAWHSNLYN